MVTLTIGGWAKEYQAASALSLLKRPLKYKGPAYNGSDFLPIGTKVGSNIHVTANDWDIWKGNNGTNNVYTFRRTTNTSSVTNLDINALLVYAQNKGFLPSCYYLLGYRPVGKW